MIEFEATSDTNILVIRARGKLTDSDYRERLAPRVQSLLDHSSRLRVMFVMDDDFEDGLSRQRGRTRFSI